MEIKITRAWFGELDEYKTILDKYGAVYSEGDTCATIKIADIAELLKLPRELGYDLIIGKDGDVSIFDERIK